MGCPRWLSGPDPAGCRLIADVEVGKLTISNVDRFTILKFGKQRLPVLFLMSMSFSFRSLAKHLFVPCELSRPCAVKVGSPSLSVSLVSGSVPSPSDLLGCRG